MGTAIGYRPPPPLSGMTGHGNVVVGIGAGASLTGGSRNTLIGTAAGQGITTGHDNICIGDGAGKNLPPDACYAIVIGDLVIERPRAWWRRRRLTPSEHRALRRWINSHITDVLDRLGAK